MELAFNPTGMLAKETFHNQSNTESQKKPSRFSLDSLKKYPMFHELQLRVEKSAKEFKILVEKLWLQ